MISQQTPSAVFYYTSPNDVANNPSPLELSYHSPSTRHLCTILPTATPEPSTITEIDSAYCPQSFASWDANSAFHSKRFFGGNDLLDDGEHHGAMGSMSCPICESVIMLVVQESKLHQQQISSEEDPEYASQSCTHLCMYKCGYCHWNSVDQLKIYSKLFINMIDNSSNNNETTEKEMVQKATKEVQLKLSKAINKRKQSVVPFMNTVIQRWNEQFKLEEVNKRKTEMLLSKPTIGSSACAIANTCSVLNHKDLNSTLITSSSSSSLKGTLWSVQALDESIIQRRKHINQQVTESIFAKKDDSCIVSSLRISDLSSSSTSSTLSTLLPSSNTNDSNKQFRSLSQCTISTTNAEDEHKALMPTPVKLRTRAIKRDYKELSLGKPGILIKPKVNPLEGDSSLRYGQGQWWKKDSSAIHTIPKISIHKLSFHEESSQYALLLRISNPTLGLIRLKVHTNFTSTFHDSFHTTFPPTYHNLVMSSFPLNVVRSKVIPPNHNCSNEMECVSLEPIEDAFLELGGISGNVHPETLSKVKNWESSISWKSLNDDDNDDNNDEDCNCKLISQQNDVAYVEFKVYTKNSLKSEEDTTTDYYKGFISTPLILDIEIGNGSWDSSLIQGKHDESEKEFVPFVVLPTWKA